MLHRAAGPPRLCNCDGVQRRVLSLLMQTARLLRDSGEPSRQWQRRIGSLPVLADVEGNKIPPQNIVESHDDTGSVSLPDGRGELDGRPPNGLDGCSSASWRSWEGHCPHIALANRREPSIIVQAINCLKADLGCILCFSRPT